MPRDCPLHLIGKADSDQTLTIISRATAHSIVIDNNLVPHKIYLSGSVTLTGTDRSEVKILMNKPKHILIAYSMTHANQTRGQRGKGQG